MIPFEKDFIRYFATRDRIHKKQANIKKQLSYCTQIMEEDTAPLSPEQQKEIQEYWDKISFAYPINTQWHQMYAHKTGRFSKNYIPNELHYYFVEYGLINFDYLRAFTDKNYLGLLFPEIKQPPVVLRCINGLFYDGNYSPVNKEQAYQQVCAHSPNGIVIKPSIHSWGGRNISFFREELSAQGVEKIFLDYGKNFIVQNVITQHSALAAIHSESVNTMRIITILLDGEVNILSACLRMGVGKSQVDNFSQGGVGCGIQQDGHLRSVGYDRFGKKVQHHPSGFHFEDCVIPNYSAVLDAVKTVAMRVPQFGVASWDFALDEAGCPVLIEYNVGQGGIDIHQYNNGPLYGEKTDKVIDHIFKNYCFEDTTLQYNYNVFSDHITVKTGSKEMPRIRIKSCHHDLPVTRIGSHAFENASVRKVSLPKTVTHVDYCAFYGCKNLRRVILPDGLLTIGRSAFNSCTNLKSLRLPKTVTTISTRAFKGIDNLCISIPPQTTSIAPDAFEDCSNVHIRCKANSYAHEYAQKRGFIVTCV